MDPISILAVLAVVFGGLSGSAALIAHAGRETPQEREAREAAERKATIKRLRDENDILRLENGLLAKKEWAGLTQLQIEAKGVGLVQRRDERMLDVLAARQAMMRLFEEAMGGRTTRTIDGDPVATAIAALSDEIENRKADGEETAELEAALTILRGRQR